MTDKMTEDLAEVVRLIANVDHETGMPIEKMAMLAKSGLFIRTHHTNIAQNAEDSKRLKALEQAMDEASSEDFESFSGTCVDRLKERADEIMRGGE